MIYCVEDLRPPTTKPPVIASTSNLYKSKSHYDAMH